jgi:hypothetical protein
MSEIKAGDTVTHKANGKRAVVLKVLGDKLEIDFGDGHVEVLPAIAFTPVSSPDILARLTALERRVAEIERGEDIRQVVSH